ncbi:hypothetical protein [Xanthomonas fragariae]|uniref:hypothetical protein n=1 Tax=Xanthomonas fragariae TaxID=48664 RepID=UPI001ABE4895|nr:hypothetical protein [Xanthomonas fragariae]UKR53968.1 TniQ family protein [Xanthomonas fragariae]
MPAVDVVSNGLVSARLEHQQGLSAFGTLLHVARLNHFHGPDFRAAFGLHFQYRDDLSHVLAFSERNQARLAATAGISQELQSLWSVEPWHPFAGEGLWSTLPWSLRACPSCLRAGYHSNLFQMPWMAQCPWHRTKLIHHCRKCNRPLLEGFRQGLDLMCCPCGTDLVNERAVLKGDPHEGERGDFLAAYLGWTAVERGCNTLFLPPLLSITRQIASPLPTTSLTTREREALALEPVVSAPSTSSRQDLLSNAWPAASTWTYASCITPPTG